jgi:hypothetical protein
MPAMDVRSFSRSAFAAPIDTSSIKADNIMTDKRFIISFTFPALAVAYQLAAAGTISLKR